MKKRQSNFELLRIVAMLMIITLHYLSKGGVIFGLQEDRSIANHVWNLLEAFCLVAVNVYVLISGYFMVDAEWRIGKAIKLWLEIMFYSLIVPVVLGAFGLVDLGSLELGTWQQILMPIQYEHYWFATAYLMMYLLSPVLATAINKLEKNQLQKVILGLLTVFCVAKSINPYLIPWDKYGYDFSWFICLFLIAGYIRKYGIACLENKKWSGIALYVCSVVLTWCICLVVALIASRTGKLGYYVDMTYSYNYITVLTGSIGLFYCFKNLSLDNQKNKDDVTSSDDNNSRISGFINKVAGCTFGVYLLHENILIRNEWMHLLGIDAANGTWWQIFHLIFCVVVVFIIGILVDLVRKNIFRLFSKYDFSK